MGARAGERHHEMETTMRSLAFGAVLFTAAATSLCAESVAPSPGAPGAAPLPPEQLVAPVAPTKVAESPALGGGGKSANICQELVAFVEQRTRTGAQSTPARQDAPAPPAPAQGTTWPPAGPPLVDVPQQKSGMAAPVPPPESAQKPPFVTVEQARAYLHANDLLACQEAARQMRRAGAPMPDGLIALAALRPDLLQAGQDSR
jgi:hypothetical protein